MNDSDQVRAYVTNHYIVPARRSGSGTVTVRAGDVHKAMKWNVKKVPQVCSALSTRKFLNYAHVELLERKGPPSGQSTTVEFTFRLLPSEAGGQPSVAEKKTVANGAGLLALYGILKDAYAELGGGEAYLKAERAAWSPDSWEKLALEDKQRARRKSA
jgi:hypothetical protein